jgi:hypothetical protein
MNDIHDLERQLRTAGERCQRAIAALAPKHKSDRILKWTMKRYREIAE